MHPGREGERTGFLRREWMIDGRQTEDCCLTIPACLLDWGFAPPLRLSTFVPGGFFSREWW